MGVKVAGILVGVVCEWFSSVLNSPEGAVRRCDRWVMDES